MDTVFLILVAIVLVWLLALVAGYQWSKRSKIWIVHGYYGTGRVMLGRMTRRRALALTAEKFGTVMFVDDENGFIFYKPKETQS